VIYPGGKCRDFQSGLIIMGNMPKWKNVKIFFFKMVKNTKIFQGVLVVMCDLTRWKMQWFFKNSHYNRQPVRWKIQRFFKNGLIIMGDLPRWKIQRFFLNGFIVIGDLPRLKMQRFSKWSSSKRWPAQVKNAKIFWVVKNVNFSRRWKIWMIFQSGLIIMGNLSKRKNTKIF